MYHGRAKAEAGFRADECGSVTCRIRGYPALGLDIALGMESAWTRIDRREEIASPGGLAMSRYSARAATGEVWAKASNPVVRMSVPPVTPDAKRAAC